MLKTLAGKHIQRFLLVALLLVVIPVRSFSAEVIDDENQLVSFSKPFSRIISLYPAHTENLVYLGALSELIGVGTSDDYPSDITDKPRFSYNDNAEKFLAAAPDLILIRPMIARTQPELIAQLKASGITIVSLQPTSVEQMYSYWQMLGLLCGKTEQAERMTREFKQSLAGLRQSVPQDLSARPGVYFESIHSKMKTFAPDAISVFALTAGGGRNIAFDAKGRNESNIAPYGKERILSKADAIDIYLSQVGRMNRVTVDDIYAEPGFQLIKAVKTKSVYLIEEEIVSRPTMRLLQGVRKIQSFLYPALENGRQDIVRHQPPQNTLLKWQ
jgi:iron complex transport system substrate-binding protein